MGSKYPQKISTGEFKREAVRLLETRARMESFSGTLKVEFVIERILRAGKRPKQRFSSIWKLLWYTKGTEAIEFMKV